MPFADLYRRQAALLVRVLPYVAEEKVFALKGGTAINLFVRNMPRLSVDIDLTYLPIEPRPASLAAIDGALRRITERVKKNIRGAQVTEARIEDRVTKLVIRAEGVQIKIDVTPVMRGCVFEAELRSVAEDVEEAFGFAEMRLVSFADLYAGKAVATLDRQHPRDLFDARDLLANEGIDDALRRAFVAYMLSHDRPMFEVLAPTRKDIKGLFERDFNGMTNEPVSLEELVAAREAFIKDMVGNMPSEHREFLISFEKGKPEWDLLGLPHVADLPAVKWRQLNLDKLSAEKRGELVANLERVLSE